MRSVTQYIYKPEKDAKSVVVSWCVTARHPDISEARSDVEGYISTNFAYMLQKEGYRVAYSLQGGKLKIDETTDKIDVTRKGVPLTAERKALLNNPLGSTFPLWFCVETSLFEDGYRREYYSYTSDALCRPAEPIRFKIPAGFEYVGTGKEYPCGLYHNNHWCELWTENGKPCVIGKNTIILCEA